MDTAQAVLAEALDLRREIQGDGHPETLTAMNNLGELLRDKGDLAEAEALLREALQFARDAQLAIAILDLDFGQSGFGEEFGKLADELDIDVHLRLATGIVALFCHVRP